MTRKEAGLILLKIGVFIPPSPLSHLDEGKKRHKDKENTYGTVRFGFLDISSIYVKMHTSMWFQLIS